VSLNDPISQKYGATKGGWDLNHFGAAFKDYKTGIMAGEEWSLRSYNKRGQHSIYDMVAHTWPASGEGTRQTELIARNIARSMGIDEHADLQLNDPEHMKRWVRALTAQEQG
jgi:hypothetical protein